MLNGARQALQLVRFIQPHLLPKPDPLHTRGASYTLLAPQAFGGRSEIVPS